MHSELQVKKKCYIKKKNLNLRNVVFVHKYILKMSDGMLCYRTNTFPIMYVYVQVHAPYFIHSEFNCLVHVTLNGGIYNRCVKHE